MAGHSKWANIKHKKEKEDARRGKVFTKLSRQITVAAREGGPDPAANGRLRLIIEKARAVNMPMENIERAIKRGTGELDGASYEEIVYEGYGPGGVAILMEIMTDNRNRTASEVRNIFSRHGGNLGETGCVAWMFERRGLLTIERGAVADEDALILAAAEAGADDVTGEQDHFAVQTEPGALEQVKDYLTQAGYAISSAELTMVPKSTVAVGAEDAARLMKLLNALEDHDDVQEVYANFDIPDEVLQTLEV